MKLNVNGLNDELKSAIKSVSKILGIEVFDSGNSLRDTFNVNLSENSDKKISTYELIDNKLIIEYSKKVHIFRAIGLVKEKYNKSSSANINGEISAEFDSLTFMIDNSRNAVLNVPTAKKIIIHLALMGYTAIMLYTEDTYEIPGHPYFGYMRGRFSTNEIKQLDEFSRNLGIELVPCIQTLAHLNTMLRWREYDQIKDINDVLLVGEEKTYEFLETALSHISKTFSCKKINIGMDEAFFLGKGKYLNLNGHKKSSEIMLYHLNRVLSLCKKYNFEPMMWSDMFFKNGDEESGNILDDPNFKYKDYIKLIHWDYYAQDESKYISDFSAHKKLTENIGFAGGAWKWDGFAPFNTYSYNVGTSALKACKKANIRDIIVTTWGDDGAEGSCFSILPILQLFAEHCYSENPLASDLKERLETCANANWDDFLIIDMLNLVSRDDNGTRKVINPGKYLLYQDILIGLYDKHVKYKEFSKIYLDAISIFDEIISKGGQWQYLFEIYKSMAQILSLKVDMGISLVAAYKRKDKEELKNLVKDLLQIHEYVEEFLEKVREQWFYENKPFGFEVIDVRIGGLKARIESSIIRVNEYIDGKVEVLEELEQERLLSDCRKREIDESIHTHASSWRYMISAGNI